MGRVKRGMEMRRIIGWIFVFAALTAAGCGRRGTPREFSVDGFLATEHPDSARRLLQRIDPERLNRDDRARWALIMGLAEVSSGDTLTGKKFLDRGMRYYERHGSDGERAAAWYTYAQAHVKTGNLEEGIRGYTQAAILAEKALAAGSSDDSLRRGTETLLVAVYHTLGLLYFEQGYDAVEPFAKAVEAARANGNTEQEGYSRFMLASAHCAAGDYQQAIETLAPLVEVADTIPFRYFAQQIRLQNLIFHTYLGDWTPEQLLEARKGIDLKVIRRAPLSYGSAVSEDTGRSFYDVASAIIFQRDGQLDSARCYIEESLACRDTFHQGSVGLFNLAAEIYHDRGDDARAYDYMQQYVSVKDSLFEAQRGAQVAELERRYRTANEVALREASLRYRAWIAGASGGCQAEIGTASAMAAGALTSLRGGDPQQIGHAAAMALKNLMGLVCDPVAGLVEVPCVKRNVVGSVNAVSCADMALAGVESRIPVDEVIDCMGEVGRRMPMEMRGTALGGLAATPTGKAVKERMEQQD